MLRHESVISVESSEDSYSKSLAFPAWGMFPRLAILFSAGGLPANGGGVVLPSNGCATRCLDFRQ